MKTFALWLVFALILSLASPAQAIHCREWIELSAEEQETAITQAVDEVLASSKAQKWTSVNFARIRQCLMRSLDSIRVDFDDTASGCPRWVFPKRVPLRLALHFDWGRIGPWPTVSTSAAIVSSTRFGRRKSRSKRYRATRARFRALPDFVRTCKAVKLRQR